MVELSFIEILVSLVALVALVFSGTSAVVLYKYVKPRMEKVDPLLEAGTDLVKNSKKYQEEIVGRIEDTTNGLREELRVMKEEALDTVKKYGNAANLLLLSTKEEFLEYFDDMGQNIGEGIGGALQHMYSQAIGTKGAAQRLKNVKTREGAAMMQDIAMGGTGEGGMIGMIDEVADRFGIPKDLARQYAPMLLQKIAPQLGQMQGQGQAPVVQPAKGGGNSGGNLW